MERFQYSGSAPGANTNATTLFDSTIQLGAAGALGRARFRSFAVALKNSHSGSVRASMRDASGSWQAFRTEDFAASPAGAANTLTLEIGHCADLKIEWVNGGSAQTTWFVAMVLSELDRDEFRLADEETVAGDLNVADDMSVGGTLAVTGNAEVTGDAAVGGALDVTGDITTDGTVDGRDVAADGTKLDATSRGYRGARAVVAQTDTTVLDDAGKLVTAAHVTSTDITIPPNSSVAYALNERIDFAALPGAGATTLVAGAGVTLTPETGKTLVLAAAGVARATKIATNVWYVTGSLVAA